MEKTTFFVYDLQLCEDAVQMPKYALFWQNLPGSMERMGPYNYVNSGKAKAKPSNCG